MGKISIKQMNETLANYSENFPKTDTEKENLFEMCLILSNYIRRGLIRFDTEEEENDFAFYFAEEIYAQVVSGRKVKYWVSYMRKSVLGYIEKFRNLNGIYSTDEEELLIDPNFPARYNKIGEPEIALRVDACNDIVKLYKDARKCITKCNLFSSANAKINAKLSFVLSVKYKHFVPFHIKDKDANICRFIYNNFRKAFVDIVDSARHTSILTDQQLGVISWLQYSTPYEMEE